MIVNNSSDTMTTSSQVLEKLRNKGIDKEFRYNGSGFSIDNGRSYLADELEIVKIYRFEGESNPSDMEVIYLISAGEGLTGFFQHGYGPAAGQEDIQGLNNFLRDITERGHEEQVQFEL